jgi:hypothetical protein
MKGEPHLCTDILTRKMRNVSGFEQIASILKFRILGERWGHADVYWEEGVLASIYCVVAQVWQMDIRRTWLDAL